MFTPDDTTLEEKQPSLPYGSFQTTYRLDSAQAPTEPVFRPRKAHNKSRNGCGACKKRRIKCGEERPHCSRCVRLDINCAYPKVVEVTANHDPEAGRQPRESQPSPCPHAYSMSVAVAGTNMLGLLRLPNADHSLANNGALENVRLLRHFHAVTSLTLGSKPVQSAMHSYVAQAAWQEPYLMHVVLAVASAHLKRLLPKGALGRRRPHLALTEAEHWQTGLQLYRVALKMAAQHPVRSGDVLISTTFLTVIYTFALSEGNERNAYLTAYDDAVDRARGPMMAGSGINALRFALGVFDGSSVWKTVISAGDDGGKTFTSDAPGVSHLPQAFVDLCKLDDNSTLQNNDYHVILRHLTPLLRLEPSPAHFVKLIAFGGRTSRQFGPLLAQRDNRALLLLAYWFALLGQVDQWWLTGRARSECLAITTFLMIKGDSDIQALLPYPASFGKADLSYLWQPLSSLHPVGDTGAELNLQATFGDEDCW